MHRDGSRLAAREIFAPQEAGRVHLLACERTERPIGYAHTVRAFEAADVQHPND